MEMIYEWLYENYYQPRAGEILEAAGISPQERGEKLDIHGFIAIAEAARRLPELEQAGEGA